MERAWFWAIALGAATLVGCGADSEKPPSTAASADGIGDEAATTTVDESPDADNLAATETVKAYLEGWKAGDAAKSNALLTQLAQAEGAKHDLVIFPDEVGETADFKILGTEIVSENDRPVAHVGVEWTDLDDTGNPQTEKYVFFLRDEPEYGWRVFGMALKPHPRIKAVAFNFEDPADVEKKWGEIDKQVAKILRAESTRSLVTPLPNQLSSKKSGSTAKAKTASNSGPSARVAKNPNPKKGGASKPKKNSGVKPAKRVEKQPAASADGNETEANSNE